jgi:hypothetical protein
LKIRLDSHLRHVHLEFIYRTPGRDTRNLIDSQADSLGLGSANKCSGAGMSADAGFASPIRPRMFAQMVERCFASGTAVGDRLCKRDSTRRHNSRQSISPPGTGREVQRHSGFPTLIFARCGSVEYESGTLPSGSRHASGENRNDFSVAPSLPAALMLPAAAAPVRVQQWNTANPASRATFRSVGGGRGPPVPDRPAAAAARPS